MRSLQPRSTNTRPERRLAQRDPSRPSDLCAAGGHRRLVRHLRAGASAVRRRRHRSHGGAGIRGRLLPPVSRKKRTKWAIPTRRWIGWAIGAQAAMTAWRAKEDAWLATLATIDPAQLEGTDAAIPYAFTRDRLEASVARRVCHTSDWNISPTWTGWQSMLASTFAQQPVGTDAERATALTRLRAVPAYLDTEIANARAGMAAGYLAPASNVRAVIAQADAMLAGAPEASPFFDPAARAKNDAFSKDVRHAGRRSASTRRFAAIVTSSQKEYRGRDAVGVSANPDGAACYAASLRFHTSLSRWIRRRCTRPASRRLARIEGEMAQIARDHFKTSDVKALAQSPAHRSPVHVQVGSRRAGVCARGRGSRRGPRPRLVRVRPRRQAHRQAVPGVSEGVGRRLLRVGLAGRHAARHL